MRRRVLGFALACALGLVGPGRPVRAEEAPMQDAALEARIQALEDERDRISLTGSVFGVAAGVLILQGGLSTIVSAQYNCPGYWNCSDETRWGLTAGSGAAIVVGAITLVIMGPRLSERLQARRELRLEMHRLRMEGGAIGARKPKPSFDWGLALDDRRQGFHATLRF
ncbi:MAG: hypothetical protein IPK00_22230 [Deltaproteobacteria bacterium]|nr:hypothetical protein [Deltaproteobacteria bacterium]